MLNEMAREPTPRPDALAYVVIRWGPYFRCARDGTMVLCRDLSIHEYDAHPETRDPDIARLFQKRYIASEIAEEKRGGGASSESPKRKRRIAPGWSPGIVQKGIAPSMCADPPSKETAIAIVVAPQDMEQVIAEVQPDQLLGLIWWLDQIIQRANAAKKCAVVEASMALDRMELSDPHISVGGHTFMLREQSRAAWSDLARLLGALERDYDIPTSDLHAAVSDARVTELRELAARIPDPDKRADALELIEGARYRRSAGMALVDLDDPYRRGR